MKKYKLKTDFTEAALYGITLQKGTTGTLIDNKYIFAEGTSNEIRFVRNFVENNPNIFEQILDIDELMEEARERYPVGTRVRSAISSFVVAEVVGHKHSTQNGDEIWIQGVCPNYGIYNVRVYYKGKWAEIVEPLFTTEDGVKVYNGDTVWYINLDYTIKSCVKTHRPVRGFTYFSTEEAAKNFMGIINLHRKYSAEEIKEIIDKELGVEGSIGQLIAERLKAKF